MEATNVSSFCSATKNIKLRAQVLFNVSDFCRVGETQCLRNTGKHSPHDTASYLKTLESSMTLS